jgi:hypothetical protein
LTGELCSAVEDQQYGTLRAGDIPTAANPNVTQADMLPVAEGFVYPGMMVEMMVPGPVGVQAGGAFGRAARAAESACFVAGTPVVVSVVKAEHSAVCGAGIEWD